MEKFKYIFFDLDGTVVNSATGITESVLHAMHKVGLTTNSSDLLNKFIGPPLRKSFMKYCKLTSEQAEKAVEYYREQYSDKGIFRGHVYYGVDRMLAYIHSKGKKIVLATSKPEIYANRILEEYEIDKFFCYAAGETLDGTRDSKADVIRYALESLKIDDLSQVLMLGDRCYDIEGAHEVGIKAAGVTYGYGTEAQLHVAGADYIASNMAELIHIIMLDE